MADLNNRFDDKVSKDRQARGDGQRIKLSSEEVLEIYASSDTIQALMHIYQVGHTCITNIRNQRSWVNLTAGLDRGG